MSTKFDITKVKPGDVLPCECSTLSVRVLCTDCGDKKFPIIGLVSGTFGATTYDRHLGRFTKNGTCMWSDDDHDFNLVLPEVVESLDVCIYRHKPSGLLSAFEASIDAQDNLYTLLKKVTIEI